MIDKVKLDQLMSDLRQQRDELRLQLHLAKADELGRAYQRLKKSWKRGVDLLVPGTISLTCWCQAPS